MPPMEVRDLVPGVTDAFHGRRHRRGSRFVGVCRDRNKWRWTVCYQGVITSRRAIEDEETAARDRDAFIRRNKLPNWLNFYEEG
jgi:hypothetical protein